MRDLQITHTPVDVEQIGRIGLANIEVKIPGYWSTSAITVYVYRDYKLRLAEDGSYIDDPKWLFQPQHSSGGRDSDQVPDDIEAAEWFAKGVLLSIAISRQLRDNVTELERFYQLQRAEEKAQREVWKAEYDARVAADMPLGQDRAEALLALAVVYAQTHRDGAHIKTISRGGDDPGPTARVKYNHATMRPSYLVNGGRVARKELLQRVAESSHRTYAENDHLVVLPTANSAE